MPVVTRSQATKARSEKMNFHTVRYNKCFVLEMKNLLFYLSQCNDMKSRVEYAVEVFDKINNDLPHIIPVDGVHKWKGFLWSVYRKIDKFYDEYCNECYRDIDESLVEKLIRTIFVTQDYLESIIGRR